MFQYFKWENFPLKVDDIFFCFNVLSHVINLYNLVWSTAANTIKTYINYGQSILSTVYRIDIHKHKSIYNQKLQYCWYPGSFDRKSMCILTQMSVL